MNILQNRKIYFERCKKISRNTWFSRFILIFSLSMVFSCRKIFIDLFIIYIVFHVSFVEELEWYFRVYLDCIYF